MARRPMRLVNQLESGTSSTVLTLSARTSRRSPGVPNGIDDEVVAVGVFDLADFRRIEGAIVVGPERIVGIEARRRGAEAASQRAGHERRRRRRRTAGRTAASEHTAQHEIQVLAIPAAEGGIDAEDDAVVGVEAEPEAVVALRDPSKLSRHWGSATLPAS